MISLATAKAYLQATGENAVRDALLARFITGMTAVVGRELGIYLGAPEQFTEVIPIMGSLIVLSDEPIKQDDGTGPVVVVEQRLWLSQSWLAMDPKVWELDGRALRLLEWRRYYGLSAWWIKRGQDLARVTYRRGCAEDGGPAELNDVVAQAVTVKFRRLGSEHLASERIGQDYSYTVADLQKVADWPELVKRWRRQLV